MKFISKDIAAASAPDLQVKNALLLLAETLAKAIKADIDAEDK